MAKFFLILTIQLRQIVHSLLRGVSSASLFRLRPFLRFD
jgi:hypothetical protein